MKAVFGAKKSEKKAKEPIIFETPTSMKEDLKPFDLDKSGKSDE